MLQGTSIIIDQIDATYLGVKYISYTQSFVPWWRTLRILSQVGWISLGFHSALCSRTVKYSRLACFSCIMLIPELSHSASKTLTAIVTKNNIFPNDFILKPLSCATRKRLNTPRSEFLLLNCSGGSGFYTFSNIQRGWFEIITRRNIILFTNDNTIWNNRFW